jgi:hypothetical protein
MGARIRVKPATDNYALLGGRSLLLELTRAQAEAPERSVFGPIPRNACSHQPI